MSEQFWTVGDVVRKLRGKRKQAKLAKEAGLETGTLRRIETDQKYEHANLERVAAVLKTPLDAIYAHASAPTMTPLARQALELFEQLTRAQRLALLDVLREKLSPEALAVARRFAGADQKTQAIVQTALVRVGLRTSQSPSIQSPGQPSMSASGTPARVQKSRKVR